MSRTLSTMAVVAVAISTVLAQTPTVDPASLTMSAFTSLGCYASAAPLIDQGPWTYQAMGNCQPLCYEQDLPVLAMFNGTNCYCGKTLPSDKDKVADSFCKTPCNGFPDQFCGGPSHYVWYLDGVSMTAPLTTARSTPTTMATTTPPKQTQPQVTDPQQNIVASTVFITQPNGASPSVVYLTQSAAPNNAAPGTNKAAIAAGVVVGVVALLAIIGGIVFFLRQKKRRELAEEMRRHESVTNFVSTGEKKPSSVSSTNDSRLEPTFNFGRRMSDGSIADNVDYSRRILKVRNPDDA